MPSNNAKKVKNPCKICSETVTEKTGIRCEGACRKWAHFKCLNYTPGKIQDIKAGLVRVKCPCPNCDPGKKVTNNCGKAQCPASKKPMLPTCPPAKPVQPTCPDVTCAGKHTNIRRIPHQRQTPGDGSCSHLQQTSFSSYSDLRHKVTTKLLKDVSQQYSCPKNAMKLEMGAQSNYYQPVVRTLEQSTSTWSFIRHSACTMWSDKSDLWPVQFCEKRKKEVRVPTTSRGIQYSRSMQSKKSDMKPASSFGQNVPSDSSRITREEPDPGGDVNSTTSLPSGVHSVFSMPEIDVKQCKSEASLTHSFHSCGHKINNIMDQMGHTMGLLQTQFKDFFQKMICVRPMSPDSENL